MSFFKALAATEEQSDQGWGYSNSYTNNNASNNSNNSSSNNQHPSSSSSHSSTQHHASFTMSTAGTGGVHSNPQGVKHPDPENNAELMEEFEGDSDEFEGDPEDFDYEGYPEDFEDYPLYAQGHYEDPEGHFEGYYDAGQEHFEGGPEQFEDGQEHFEDGQEHFEGGQERFEDDPEHFQDDQEHFEGDRGHFEGDQEHFEGDQEHFEGDQEHFEEDQEHFEGGEEAFEGDQEHFESVQEHSEGGQNHKKQGHFQSQEHFEGGQEHFKSGHECFKNQGHLEGSQGHFQRSHRQFENQGQFESSQGHFKNGQGHIKSQGQFEDGQEQAHGDPRHFDGDAAQFEDYPDEFDDEFFDEEEDFDGEEEDFEFENQQGHFLQKGQIESSSGFQNSYNKYIMSQYPPLEEDMLSDYDDHSDEDGEHEGEEEQQSADQPGTRDISPQRTMHPQPVKSGQQERQMRLPLLVQGNREFSSSPSQSGESPGRPQSDDQKSAGSHLPQQKEARTDQQPPYHHPRQVVSQGAHGLLANRLPPLQAKPQQAKTKAANEVAVTSQNVTVSTYNHRNKNSSRVMSHNQQSFPRMPNLRMNNPNQYHYQLPGQNVRYAALRVRQQGTKNWHMPQKEQAFHARLQERRQQIPAELSKCQRTEQKFKEGEEQRFVPQRGQPPRPNIPHHFPNPRHALPRQAPHPAMQNPSRAPVRGFPPRPWHTPRGPPQSPSGVGQSSQGLVDKSSKVIAQRPPHLSGKQPCSVSEREGHPQGKQTVVQALAKNCPTEVAKNCPPEVARNCPPEVARNCPPELARKCPPEMARNCPADSASTSSYQPQPGQRPGRRLQAKPKSLSKEMQEIFSLSTEDRVIFHGGKGDQGLQKDIYDAVQKCKADGGSVMCYGSDGKKYIVRKLDSSQRSSSPQVQPKANLSFSESVQQRTNTPMSSPSVQQRTNTPMSSPSVQQRTNTPMSSPSVQQRTNTPVSSPPVQQRTNTPMNSPSVQQRTNTPMGSPPVHQRTNTPMISSSVQQRTNTPMNSSSVQQRTNTPLTKPPAAQRMTTALTGPQAQQRMATSHGNKGSVSGEQDPATGVHTTSEDHRSQQGGCTTSVTTNVTTSDGSTICSKASHSSDSSTTTTVHDGMVGKLVTDSLTKRIVENFMEDEMNGEMDASFDSDMMDFDEDFDEDEDFDDDEVYYDEEEEREHDAVLRELEEMGDLSPRLPVGVPPWSDSSKGWPTSLPSVCQKKGKVEAEGGAGGVEFVSSSSQRSCNSPVFGFSPHCTPQEARPSSPGSGAKESHLTSLQPVQLSIPGHSELVERRGAAKRPLAEDEERTVLCKRCGQCSNNLEVCVNCKRTFPSDVEVFVKRRKMETPDSVYERERTCGGGKVNSLPSDTGFVLDKNKFYGNRESAERESFFNDEDDNTDSFVIRNNERSFSRLHRDVTNFPSQRKVFRGVKEPVTVTISSDEDEGPGNDQGQQSTIKPATGKPTSVATVSTGATMATAAAATGVAHPSTTVAQEKEDSFFSPIPKPTSTFGTARRSRMEDATGRCIRKTRSPLRFVGEGVYFNVRGIRIGSMRTSGIEVRFMTRSIAFTVVSDRTQEELDFFVYVSDIKSMAFSLEPPQPVAFLHVTPGCGTRLRSQLKMVNDSPEYFDPGSRDPQKNMIVLIIETMTDEAGLRDMLNSYSKTLKIDNFLTELDCDEANDLLVSSTPPVLSNPNRNLPHGDTPPGLSSPSPRNLHDDGDDEGREGEEGEEGEEAAHMAMAGDAGMYPPEEYDGYDEYEEEDDGCPPSPYYGFVGPVEKLLTYPPAPAKGGISITNQDLFCLNEGEFLNDVILDFYLKYIFLEKLTEEDRQRTHIFSSFFFKRLTQKQARSAQDQEEVKLSLPERRHSRVRTWTRQVDIFSKDFLLIPINENAHWFLAIVCFPSLAGEEYVSFQPSPLCEPEEPAVEPAEESAETAPAAPATPAPAAPPAPSPPPPAPAPPAAIAAQQPESQKTEEGETTMVEDPDSQPDTATSSTTDKEEECVLGRVIPMESALQSQPADYKLGLRQPCILVMDSLMGPSRNSIIKILKEYLQVEWDLKKGTPHDIMNTVRGGCPQVPQQNNFSDCGVYVLQYAESFFENPIANYALPMPLERWFPRSQVARKREEIHNLILTLREELDGR